jgi:hypothetical protein
VLISTPTSALTPVGIIFHIYRNINYQGVVTAQWRSWGRPNTPPERPLSPPEPLRCPLGPWSAPAAPASPAGLSGGGLPPPRPPRPRPLRGHNAGSRHPAGRGCPPAASRWVLVGRGWPLWGFGAAWGVAFHTHLHTLPQTGRLPVPPRGPTEQDQFCKLT